MTLESYLEVYEKYFKLARKVAFDLLKDYYLSGDVAQDVFMEMFLKKDELDASKIKYWVVLNSNRRAIDVARKAYRKHEMRLNGVDEGELEYSMRAAGNPEEAVLRNEAVMVKSSALEQLKRYNYMWYDILIRKYFKNESAQSLALAYGMKVDTLYVHVCRARKWLDQKVYELYGED